MTSALKTVESREVQERRREPVIINKSLTEAEAHTTYRNVELATGRQLTEMVGAGKLDHPVRGDVFAFVPAAGEVLGKRFESDGYTCDVPEKYQNRPNLTIVFSFSKSNISQGDVKGHVVKAHEVPENKGWFKVDPDTGIPMAGRPSNRDDPEARYWYRRPGKDGKFGGVVVFGGNDWHGGEVSGGRGVVAGYGPSDKLGVALAGQVKPKLVIAQAQEKSGLLVVSGVTLRKFNVMLQGSRREIERAVEFGRSKKLPKTEELLRTLELKG